MERKVHIRHLFISPGHDFKGRHGKGRLKHRIESVEKVDCVANRGLVGDRFFDHEHNFKGQVSFIGLEAIEAAREELGLAEVAPAKMRRNVVVSGIDLNGLVGKRFELGGTEFMGTEECAPCYWMDQAVAVGAAAALKGRGGLRCRILKSGTLELGENVLKIL